MTRFTDWASVHLVYKNQIQHRVPCSQLRHPQGRVDAHASVRLAWPPRLPEGPSLRPPSGLPGVFCPQPWLW